MATPDERRLNNVRVENIIALACNGNHEAEKYLSCIGYVSRVMDDLIDKDCEVSDSQIARAYFMLLAELWMNPFFISNASMLMGLHIASYNSWIDATRFERDGDKLKKIYGHVMKDFINELIGVVAYLTGGYDHMRLVSEKTKETFLEEVS